MFDPRTEELIRRNHRLLETAERSRRVAQERANRSSTKRVIAQRKRRSNFALIRAIYREEPEPLF
jgi:hypothetical protein